jgi:glycosyltransferase involved in cell wall biosynthesis
VQIPIHVLIQPALPEYRRVFIEELIERHADARLRVFVGPEAYEDSVKTSDAVAALVDIVENKFFFGRRLLWQRVPLRTCLAASVVICDLNPRCLSNWAVLVLRKVRRRPTVVWGHISGKVAGTSPFRRMLRASMLRLASVVVTYTEEDRRRIINDVPRARVVAAPNALMRRKEMGATRGLTDPRHFIYVGRLTPQKRPGLLIEAFCQARGRLGTESKLLVVGDGPLRSRLEAMAERSNSPGIEFLGSQSSPSVLKSLYADSLASVSPGYVGLSLTQSLGFGVPMIIARDEPHSPEIEAATNGVNAVFFESGSVSRLASALVGVADSSAEWIRRRDQIAEEAKARYSVEAMTDAVVKAIRLAARVSP